MDEDDAFALVLEVLAENLAEIVHLEVPGSPFRDAVAAGDAFDVKVHGKVGKRVFAAERLGGRFSGGPGRDGR